MAVEVDRNGWIYILDITLGCLGIVFNLGLIVLSFTFSNSVVHLVKVQFLIYLAIFDLAFSLYLVIGVSRKYSLGGIQEGSLDCQLDASFNTFFGYITLYGVVMLALDRYFVVVKHKMMTKVMSLACVIFGIAVSCGMAILILFLPIDTFHVQPTGYYCLVNLANPNGWIRAMGVLLASLFVVSCTVIMVCYVRILKKIRESMAVIRKWSRGSYGHPGPTGSNPSSSTKSVLQETSSISLVLGQNSRGPHPIGSGGGGGGHSSIGTSSGSSHPHPHDLHTHGTSAMMPPSVVGHETLKRITVHPETMRKGSIFSRPFTEGHPLGSRRESIRSTMRFINTFFHTPSPSMSYIQDLEQQQQQQQQQESDNQGTSIMTVPTAAQRKRERALEIQLTKKVIFLGLSHLILFSFTGMAGLIRMLGLKQVYVLDFISGHGIILCILADPLWSFFFDPHIQHRLTRIKESFFHSNGTT